MVINWKLLRKGSKKPSEASNCVSNKISTLSHYQWRSVGLTLKSLSCTSLTQSPSYPLRLPLHTACTRKTIQFIFIFKKNIHFSPPHTTPDQTLNIFNHHIMFNVWHKHLYKLLVCILFEISGYDDGKDMTCLSIHVTDS